MADLKQLAEQLGGSTHATDGRELTEEVVARHMVGMNVARVRAIEAHRLKHGIEVVDWRGKAEEKALADLQAKAESTKSKLEDGETK